MEVRLAVTHCWSVVAAGFYSTTCPSSRGEVD
jgi:hypothetical protein